VLAPATPAAVALAGQPCRPLRAALRHETGRDEEVVPAVEQRGYQKEERDETVLPGYRPIGALRVCEFLRFSA